MKSHEAMEKMIPLRGGHVDVHALALQRSTSLVNQWRRPSGDELNDTGKLNPIDRLEKIMRTSLGQMLPERDALAGLHCLAEKFNHVCVRLPMPSDTLNDMTQELAQTVKEMGDFMAAYGQALADGNLEDAEQKKCYEEGMEAAAALMSCLQHCKPQGVE